MCIRNTYVRGSMGERNITIIWERETSLLSRKYFFVLKRERTRYIETRTERERERTRERKREIPLISPIFSFILKRENERMRERMRKNEREREKEREISLVRLRE